MGMFKPVREGSWWMSSKKDPKWNANGRGMVGGFVMPQEVETMLEHLKTKYGDPPDDLEFGYMKD